MSNKGEVLIYQTQEGNTSVEVKMDNDTVWLTQQQMAELFNSSRVNITEHIGNVYKENELIEESTCRKFRQVQKEGKRLVEREVMHYNLDVIISIGYRINSKQGTQFRIWATQRLKEYLVRGYTLNEQRLKEVSTNLLQLEQAVKAIQKSGSLEQININEVKGLLNIITDYTRSFVLLNRFDSERLESESLNTNITYEIKYKEAIEAISNLKKELIHKKEASNLFGSPKDDSFRGILGNVVQSFGEEYLYPSIEEQAAHLLYFVIKNHPFNDGNKRIGAFLFIWFLEKNKHCFKQKGDLKINDNALVAIALLVAQSHPDQKDLMIKLIVNLINRQ